MKENFLNLASKYEIPIVKIMSTNELGLDFITAVGEDYYGKKWILRIPRRADMISQIEYEEKCLSVIKSIVSFDVPDWKVATHELIAYPLLTDIPALDVNPVSQEYTWNINLESFEYSESLASILYELHAIPIQQLEKFEIKRPSINETRQKLLDDITLIKKELGLSSRLETQWRTWIDEETYWPSFSSIIHGDLYAGHTLVDSKNNITGIIDWSEIQVGDSSLDFVGHYIGLGEAHLDKTLETYKKMGGQIWPRMKDHIVQSSSASPLKFAVFALETKNEIHIQAAREQLK